MNSLSAFMMNTLGSAAAQTVTDDTEAYSLLSTLDNTVYYFNHLLHQNPGKPDEIKHTFTRGADHGADTTKKIIQRDSTDRGQTFGAEYDLYDPSGDYQVQDPSIGVDSNGVMHILADCHDDLSVPGADHEIRYMKSTDWGATVTAPVVIPFPSTSMLSFRFYGRIIQMGSVLLAFATFFPEEGDISESENWCLRSTDFGGNWSWVLMGSSSTDYISEGEGLAITDEIGIFVFRAEGTKRYFMYKTEDAGLTFIAPGYFGFLVMSVAAPCRLHKFKLDDGTDVAEMVFMNRGGSPKTVLAAYGRLDVGVVAGIGLFKQDVVTLASDASYVLNYGDTIHPYGNMNSIGMYSRENNFPSDNEVIHFQCPSTQYGAEFGILTPVTIYDALALPQFIFAWRGLIRNNTNDWGVVNSSDQVTTIKSIYPASVGSGYNLTATAGGIILGDGLEFDGTKALSGTTALNFNFLSHSSAGIDDVQFDAYFTIKPGTSSNPNAAYGIFGTSAASAGNIGISVFYDDRAAQPRSDAIRLTISKGSAGFTIDFVNDNKLTPNVYQVVFLRVDLSQASNNDKVKMWVNNVFQTTTVTSFISTINAPPTYNFQLGAVGNNTFLFTGGIKDLILTVVNDLDSVRSNMIQTLMDLEGL